MRSRRVNPQKKQSRFGRERGVALIMALLILFVLSTIAAGLMFSTQNEILAATSFQLTTQVGLATYFGPLAEVNSGPSAEAYWTGFGVGDAMYLGLKRSESPGYIECDRSACFLAPAFLHRAPEAVAVRTGLDDVRPIRDAIQQRLA